MVYKYINKIVILIPTVLGS